MHTPDDITTARSWLSVIARTEVRAALEAIYTGVAAEIAARSPACWASGRCCNFAKSGHLLYVTGLEAAYTLHSRQPPAAGAPASTASSLAILTQQSSSPPPDSCPFLAANICSIHAIKPLACRTYFCDVSAREWQNDLTERALKRIREVHSTFSIEYRYAEWRGMLGLLTAANTLP